MYSVFRKYGFEFLMLCVYVYVFLCSYVRGGEIMKGRRFRRSILRGCMYDVVKE